MPLTRPSPTDPVALDPLFMWAGGKRRLLPKYAPHFPDLDAVTAYVEPFLGGGAVFAYVAAQRPAMPAVLGEISPELAGLYATIKAQPDAFIRAVRGHEQTWMPLDVAARKAHYYRLREAYWALPLGTVKAAALLYFLMKTGFNGIWQTCKASNGRYGTPVGLANQKTRVFDPDLVRQWSAAMAATEVRCQSYEHTDIPEGAFVFCDPPYRDSFTTYGTGFDDTHQAELVAWCRQQAQDRHALVWLANRDAGDGFFDRLAPEAQQLRIPVVYTAGRRKQTADGFEAKPATELLLIWDGRSR